MKKILTILGVTSFVTTASTSSIACSAKNDSDHFKKLNQISNFLLDTYVFHLSSKNEWKSNINILNGKEEKVRLEKILDQKNHYNYPNVSLKLDFENLSGINNFSFWESVEINSTGRKGNALYKIKLTAWSVITTSEGTTWKKLNYMKNEYNPVYFKLVVI